MTPAAKRGRKRAFTDEALLAMLKAHNWNQIATAERFGVDPRTVRMHVARLRRAGADVPVCRRPSHHRKRLW